MANFQNIVPNTFRENAEKAFYAGIKAADPEIALSNAIKINHIPAISKKGKFIVVSVGKAACKMANCLINNLPENANYNAIAVTNCTTALHLSLFALGIKEGDEVILPSFTWIATANVIEILGAKPVFCDIELENFNIDTNKIESLITSKTKAIIPVHLFGLAANMDRVMKVAKENNLYVVEDAACGFASKYKKKHVGNFGNTGCFSFHPRKSITTGEGGMITTNDEQLAEKIRCLRDHGATISDLQRHKGAKPYLLPEFAYAGFNYRMTDIQASIGTTQMDRATQIYNMRETWAKRYDEVIDTIPWLKKPYRHADYVHSFQSYVCLFQPEEINASNVKNINKRRNIFMDYLQKNEIASRPGTHAVHMLKYYAEKYQIRPEDFQRSYFADFCSISLPFFPSMTNLEFDYIIKIIRDFNIEY